MAEDASDGLVDASTSRVRLIEQLFTEVERFIADGDLERARDRLWPLGDEVSPIQRKQVVLMSQALADHRAQVLAGSMDADAEQATRNRLAGRLYDLATELRTNAFARQLDVPRSAMAVTPTGQEGGDDAATTDPTAPAEIGPNVAQEEAGATHRTAPFPSPAGAEGPHAFLCEDVSWSVRAKAILREITCWGSPGEVVAIVGRNGSGKSSLLHLLSRDRRPTSGTVRYPWGDAQGLDDAGLRDRVAHLHQRPPRFVGSVGRLLSMYASLRSAPSQEVIAELNALVERMGLTEHWNDSWSALSGGYRTRFELVRLLLGQPDLLLLDEPLAALDPPSQARYIEMVRDLARSPRRPSVVITSQHVAEVEVIADLILVLDAGEVRYWGPPDGIVDVVGRRVFDYRGALEAAALAEALAPLGSFVVRPRGTATRLLSHDEVDPGLVLKTLLDAGSVQHFSDLSGSALLLLEEGAES